MKYASDFRAQARAALRGKWLIAAAAGFIASLLGGTIATARGTSVSSPFSGEEYDEHADSFTAFWEEYGIVIIAAVSVFLIIAVLWTLALMVIGGAAELGYAHYNLHLIDGENASLGDLVSQFHRLKDGFLMTLLREIYLLLWSLLFVIPGIIKTYSYAMTPYILSENPQMSANDAITESRRIMDGNKWRLFCLEISFIGWWLVCASPVFLGLISGVLLSITSGNPLWVLFALPSILPMWAAFCFYIPYVETSWAAFYREISAKPSVTEEEL